LTAGCVHCEGCGIEIEVDVSNVDDWKDMGEMC
jgi:hypothetical protein